ncbi:MAG: hypothetical protein KBA14_00730 [Saprospiraceae bacterium]|nr:hypothetical protein [Saprospiraceae bacterium]
MLYIQILKKVPFVLLPLLLTFTSGAQRVIVNSQGDRVIVYPNGSSRMADQRDSALVRQYLQQGLSDQDAAHQQSSVQDKNIAEKQEFLLKQWNELYATILAEEKVIQQNFRTATNAKFKASELLENAQDNKKLMEPDHLANLHEEYETSVNELRKAKRCQEDIKKIVDKAQKINAAPSKLTSNKLDKTKASFNLFRAECNPGGKVTVLKENQSPPPPAPVVTPSENPSAENPKPVSPPEAMVAAAVAYDPSMVNQRPSQYDNKPYVSAPFDCSFRIDTIDQSTKTRKLELFPSLVFTHTDQDLRPYFKDKDLITAYSRLSKIGPYIYLTIDFHIASSHAQNNFGSLQNGSLLRLKLFDGEFVTLYDLKTDKGRIDPYSGHTIFSGQYALGKNEIKKILHSPLDKIRVLWATGYEDYEVYEVDKLIEQLNCLLNKK